MSGPPAPSSVGADDPDAQRALERLTEAVSALEALDDGQLRVLLETDVLPRFVQALAPIRDPAAEKGRLVYEYLMRHKTGLQLLAWLRQAIQVDYSIPGTVNGRQVYVSPDTHQWHNDGVMFLQGEERFAGSLGLF